MSLRFKSSPKKLCNRFSSFIWNSTGDCWFERDAWVDNIWAETDWGDRLIFILPFFCKLHKLDIAGLEVNWKLFFTPSTIFWFWFWFWIFFIDISFPFCGLRKSVNFSNSSDRIGGRKEFCNKLRVIPCFWLDWIETDFKTEFEGNDCLCEVRDEREPLRDNLLS